MPFRARMRKALGRTSSTSSDSPSSSNNNLTLIKSKSSKKNIPDNIYAPGEMPKPKYRGPYNKAHQEKLHAFSFGAALGGLRRRSATSQYSPMGSRMPSRRGSLTGPKRTSVDGPRKNSGLNGSRLSMTRAQSWEDRNVVGLGEVDGDDDVGNVGLSRQHTHDGNQKTTLETTKTVTNGDLIGDGWRLDSPFTEDELTRALTKTTLKPNY
ncbi:hypothetical protein MMC06_003299 [Schaereria dolodes]|nr:hypothetical protein [Schaereria dolodes]